MRRPGNDIAVREAVERGMRGPHEVAYLVGIRCDGHVAHFDKGELLRRCDRALDPAREQGFLPQERGADEVRVHNSAGRARQLAQSTLCEPVQAYQLATEREVPRRWCWNERDCPRHRRGELAGGRRSERFSSHGGI